jgi:DNA-binding NarL/FixJ family response regulator
LKTAHYALSECDLDVLYLMREGLFDQQIAYRLWANRDSIAGRVSTIVQKMGARSRTEAAVRAIKEGIFAPGH